MAEETNSSDSVKGASLPDDIESLIQSTMRSRIAYFKEQSDSLTFEGVRRLLERDLGLETLALDVLKRFVKNCLLECLHGTGDDNALKSSGDTVDSNVSTASEMGGPTKGDQSKKEVMKPCSGDEEKIEDSPATGVLSEHKATKTESNQSEHEETKEVSEGEIKKAIRKRASYLVANSHQVTLAGLRRLLEEDMKLDKHTLDPQKKFISEQIDEVLKSSEVAVSPSEAKKNPKKNSQSKAPRKSSTKKSSDSSEDYEEEEEDDDDDDDDDEEEVKRPKGKVISKGRSTNSEGLKKRKRPVKETNLSSKKRNKAPENVSDDDSNAEGGGVVSDDGHSQSSAEKTAKKKEASTPIYGKRVEHLKSVIKSCGMSVPPVIYKKVKQAPENKREAHLIKELEGILSKEGLLPNPSEREIKDVRKRKERAKELEGIDTSNIVLSSRIRSTTNFVPPKPKIAGTSDDDDDEEEEEEDDNDDDEDNDDEDGGDEDNSGSQSEGTNAEEDEDSD